MKMKNKRDNKVISCFPLGKKAMSTWIWILIALVVIAVGVGAYIFLTGDGSSALNLGGSAGSSIPQPPALPN